MTLSLSRLGDSVCHQLSENIWFARLTSGPAMIYKVIWTFGTDGQHQRYSKRSSGTKNDSSRPLGVTALAWMLIAFWECNVKGCHTNLTIGE